VVAAVPLRRICRRSRRTQLPTRRPGGLPAKRVRCSVSVGPASL